MQLGKLWGLRRIADAQGRFMMVAVDQRLPMAQLIAAARGVGLDQVSFEDMLAAKRLIAESLCSEATALLLDPNYGVPAAIAKLDVRTGLIVTLEDHRFLESAEGRRSRLIDHWSVAKARAMGADAVKLLIWYRPDASAAVLAHQKAFVEEVGVECERHDIPFILELLVYPLSGGGSYSESVEKTPELVIESVRQFAHPRFGVDLFKLESPVPAAVLPARDGTPAHQKAQSWFNQIGEICRQAGKPWVMLSAGMPIEVFSRVLEYAYAAGASGFLGGRAIWQDAVRSFSDAAKVSAALGASLERLKSLCEQTRRAAPPWRADYGGLSGFKAEGEFARSYDH